MKMGNTEGPNRNRARSKAAKAQNKTLGPVDNLEEHVNPDWWSRIFNSLYLKTDADVVDDLRITHQEVGLMVSVLNLTPDQKILDLCCGAGPAYRFH